MSMYVDLQKHLTKESILRGVIDNTLINHIYLAVKDMYMHLPIPRVSITLTHLVVDLTYGPILGRHHSSTHWRKANCTHVPHD